MIRSARWTAVMIVFAQFLFSNSLSQNLASIEGKVFDSRTKEVLPGAVVYLANTAIGVPTDVNGAFRLDGITSGKYDLTASMLGYKVFTKALILDGNSIKGLVIYLVEDKIVLKSVEIKAKRPGISNDFLIFQKYFLGTTLNGAKCKITNPHDVEITNSAESLHARSYKPIEIENGALGYRIFYILKNFVVDKANNTVTFSGIPRFENLTPENKKQEKRWARERDRAYYGSAEHFIRSLKAKALRKNRFLLYEDGNEITEAKLFTNGGDSVIYYSGKLKLVFGGELAEVTFDPQRRPQESILGFNGHKITLYNNGVYQNFEDILLLGYMGWSSNLAELMPLGYQPVSAMKW